MAVIHICDDQATLLEHYEDNSHLMACHFCEQFRKQLQTGRVAARTGDEYIALMDGALCASALTELGATLGLKLSIGVSEEVREFSQLREAYKTAALLARQARLEAANIKYAGLAATRRDQLTEMLGYMSEHLNDPSLSLQTLAERANMSKNYFATLLRSAREKTLSRFSHACACARRGSCT